MRQITYISTARAGIDRATFAEIERVSQVNNALVGLSGLLLFDGVRFLQVLEGDASAVADTLARIRRDSRHLGYVSLADKAVETPSFGAWTMLCRDTSRGDASLGAVLVPYLELCDRSVRANFQSFARLRDVSKAA